MWRAPLILFCLLRLPLMGQWPVANLANDQLLGGWDATQKHWLSAAQMKALMTRPTAYRIYSFGAWLGNATGAAPLQLEKGSPCEVDRLKIQTGFKRGLAIGSTHQAAFENIQFLDSLPAAILQPLQRYASDSLHATGAWQESSYCHLAIGTTTHYFVQLGYYGMPREGQAPQHNASILLDVQSSATGIAIHRIANFVCAPQASDAHLLPGAHVYSMQHVLDINHDGQPEVVVADAGTLGNNLWAYSWDGRRYMPVIGYDCGPAQRPHNE